MGVPEEADEGADDGVVFEIEESDSGAGTGRSDRVEMVL